MRLTCLIKLENPFSLVVLYWHVLLLLLILFIQFYQYFNILRVVVEDVELQLADEFVLLVLVVAVLEKEYLELLCNEWFWWSFMWVLLSMGLLTFFYFFFLIHLWQIILKKVLFGRKQFFASQIGNPVFEKAFDNGFDFVWVLICPGLPFNRV